MVENLSEIHLFCGCFFEWKKCLFCLFLSMLFDAKYHLN